MASLQNISYQDQGVNWRVNFQWSEDNGQSDPWHDFEANFPADFSDINADEVESEMLGIAIAVARGQGIDV